MPLSVTDLTTDLQQGLRFLKENGLAESIRRTARHDAHPLLQFLKYGLCGAFAVILTWVLVYLLGTTLLPCFGDLEISDALRQKRLIYANLIAFIPINAIVYYINRRWVFTPGRHGVWKEFSYFTVISTVSFLAGVLGGPLLLINRFGLPTEIAQLGFIVTSALVNFACRKLFVFKG